MIPYAGKPGLQNIAVISLQSQNKSLNKEVYTLRSEKLLVERDLLRARARIEELERVIDRVSSAVGPFIDTPAATFVDVEEVIHATSVYYHLDSETLRGDSRQREAILARHVAMYLASSLSRTSTVAIGRHLGGRDHTTVGSGIRRIQRIIKNDPGVFQDITKIKLGLHKNALSSSGASEAVPPSCPPSGERTASLSPMVGNDDSVGEVTNA